MDKVLSIREINEDKLLCKKYLPKKLRIQLFTSHFKIIGDLKGLKKYLKNNQGDDK